MAPTRAWRAGEGIGRVSSRSACRLIDTHGFQTCAPRPRPPPSIMLALGQPSNASVPAAASRQCGGGGDSVIHCTPVIARQRPSRTPTRCAFSRSPRRRADDADAAHSRQASTSTRPSVSQVASTETDTKAQENASGPAGRKHRNAGLHLTSRSGTAQCACRNAGCGLLTCRTATAGTHRSWMRRLQHRGDPRRVIRQLDSVGSARPRATGPSAFAIAVVDLADSTGRPGSTIHPGVKTATVGRADTGRRRDPAMPPDTCPASVLGPRAAPFAGLGVRLPLRRGCQPDPAGTDAVAIT